MSNKERFCLSDPSLLKEYIGKKAELLTEVATFHVLNRVKKQWGDFASFKAAYDCGNFWHKHSKWFHIPKLERFTTVPRDENGKQHRITKQVLAALDPSVIEFRENTTRHYKSGKNYVIYSGFFIPLSRLESLLAEGYPTRTDCGCYSAEAVRLIKKYILGYKDAKLRPLTNEQIKTARMKFDATTDARECLEADETENEDFSLFRTSQRAAAQTTSRFDEIERYQRYVNSHELTVDEAKRILHDVYSIADAPIHGTTSKPTKPPLEIALSRADIFSDLLEAQDVLADYTYVRQKSKEAIEAAKMLMRR